MLRRMSCLLTAAALVSCARPAPLVPARLSTASGPAEATALSEGVYVMANSNAWDGDPRDLPRTLNPVLLAIENDSGRPITLRLRHIALRRPDGKRLTAVHPLSITDELEGTTMVAAPLSVPMEPRRGSAGDQGNISPLLPSRDTAPGGWDLPLPSPDMLSRALNEGVLHDGRKARGFVYFPLLPKDVQRVELTLELVNARDGRSFGRVVIPFRHRGG
ncbi:MAG: hypothetical protein AB2A00_15645 [Myxococcota bacterium]